MIGWKPERQEFLSILHFYDKLPSVDVHCIHAKKNDSIVYSDIYYSVKKRSKRFIYMNRSNCLQFSSRYLSPVQGIGKKM